MSKANDYLHIIPQISKVEDAKRFKDKDVFLFSDKARFVYRDDNLVETFGLGDRYDKKLRDLIRVINVTDALNIKYERTNILTPLMFAEISNNIPWHLNTQGILFTKISEESLDWIKREIQADKYGKHRFDKFWLPFCKNIDDVKPGEVLCIFNRRVAGWDGSHERPVIELLGAGGHVPTVWDSEQGCFRELDFKENFQKEYIEELGGKINKEDIVIFGGYQNDVTHELVVLCGIEIKEKDLISLQEYAIQNIDEDTEGIYIGTFAETIEYYQKNPVPFAGGKEAAPYNFPNRKELMERAIKYSKFES